MLIHENKFLTPKKKKTGLFYSFFARQCFLISDNSRTENSSTTRTEKVLPTVEFTHPDIAKII